MKPNDLDLDVEGRAPAESGGGGDRRSAELLEEALAEAAQRTKPAADLARQPFALLFDAVRGAQEQAGGGGEGGFRANLLGAAARRGRKVGAAAAGGELADALRRREEIGPAEEDVADGLAAEGDGVEAEDELADLAGAEAEGEVEPDDAALDPVGSSVCRCA